MLETKDVLVWLIPALFSIGFMYLAIDPENRKQWILILLVSLIPFVNMISAIFAAIVSLNDLVCGDL